MNYFLPKVRATEMYLVPLSAHLRMSPIEIEVPPWAPWGPLLTFAFTDHPWWFVRLGKSRSVLCKCPGLWRLPNLLNPLGFAPYNLLCWPPTVRRGRAETWVGAAYPAGGKRTRSPSPAVLRVTGRRDGLNWLEFLCSIEPLVSSPPPSWWASWWLLIIVLTPREYAP